MLVNVILAAKCKIYLGYHSLAHSHRYRIERVPKYVYAGHETETSMLLIFDLKVAKHAINILFVSW